MKLSEVRSLALPRTPLTQETSRTGVLKAAATTSRPHEPSPLTLDLATFGFSDESSRRALFELNSIVGQVWLMQLRKRLEAGYARSAGSRAPAIQQGYAWRSFCTFFEPLSAIELVRLFENLLRFASLDTCQPARVFFLAYAPLAFEHDCSREYIGPGVWSPRLGLKKAARRVRRTLQRWCDWLEALVHSQVHGELHNNSPHLQFDKAIILLWPLVKRHRWSPSTLVKVLRLLREGGQTIGVQPKGSLAAYCRNSLGLHWPTGAAADSATNPDGREIAERLFRLLPKIA